MITYRTLEQADLRGKRVLVRVDHNIDTNGKGEFKSDEKMKLTLSTIRYLLKQDARLILMCHVGRPKGKADPKYSTAKIAAHFQTLVPDVPLTHCSQTVGTEVEHAVNNLKKGSILYLENVRFSADEEGSPAQQKAFGRRLASLADVYVNEAFASCHEYEEASTCAVARLLPAFAGIQLQKEAENLSKVTEDPKRPLVLIISGAKMETKIPVIERFLARGDDILLGGCIANTFIAARGFDVGTSKFDATLVERAQELMLEAEKTEKADIHLPHDVVVASSLEENAQKLDLPVEDIEGDMSILDIGKVTVERYRKLIAKAETIVWNGPVGYYEVNRFSHATKRIAEAVAEATKKGAISIIGGGDTIDFHTRYGYPLDVYTFVSTGGGAMLEFIGGKKMPALAALLS